MLKEETKLRGNFELSLGRCWIAKLQGNCNWANCYS